MKHSTSNQKRLGYASIFITLMLVFILGSSWTLTEITKPTFKEKVLAIAAKGGKIAVVLTPSEVTITPVQTTMHQCVPDADKATLPMDYEMAAKMIAEGLNNGFSTDAFIFVTAEDVPTKTIKAMGVETTIQDWWSTDYEMVVLSAVTASYQISGASLQYKLTASVSMMVGNVIDGKQALQYQFMNKPLGTTYTDMVDHDDCLKTIKDFEANVAPMNALVEKATEAAKEKLAGFIAKENKKYDKAMSKKK